MDSNADPPRKNLYNRKHIINDYKNTPPLPPSPESHSHNPHQMRPIYEVVLSGSGTNGIAIVGGLHALHEQGMFKHVRRWVGGSSGAAIAIFMTLGYSPWVLYQVLLKVDFASMNDVNCDSFIECFDKMGLTDGNKLLRIIQAALHSKGFTKDSTFKQLRDAHHNTLVITGYNLTRGRTEAFSADTTPNMSVWLACRISVSVPFLFRPVIMDGDMYADGCIVESSPVRFAKYKRRTVVFKTLSTGSFTDITTGDTTNTKMPLPTDMVGFFALFQKRVYQALDSSVLSHIRKKRPETLITIHVPATVSNHFVVDFAMDETAKTHLFSVGYKEAREWMVANGHDVSFTCTQLSSTSNNTSIHIPSASV